MSGRTILVRYAWFSTLSIHLAWVLVWKLSVLMKPALIHLKPSKVVSEGFLKLVFSCFANSALPRPCLRKIFLVFIAPSRELKIRNWDFSLQIQVWMLKTIRQKTVRRVWALLRLSYPCPHQCFSKAVSVLNIPPEKGWYISEYTVLFGF